MIPPITFKAARHEATRLLVALRVGTWSGIYHRRDVIHLVRTAMADWQGNLVVAPHLADIGLDDFSTAYLLWPCSTLAALWSVQDRAE